MEISIFGWGGEEIGKFPLTLEEKNAPFLETFPNNLLSI